MSGLSGGEEDCSAIGSQVQGDDRYIQERGGRHKGRVIRRRDGKLVRARHSVMS